MVSNGLSLWESLDLWISVEGIKLCPNWALSKPLKRSSKLIY
jgi:hypothetical protein